VKNVGNRVTIIGKNHQQAIVTVVERKTGFTLMQKVANKTAEAVGDALIALLKPFQVVLKYLLFNPDFQ